MKKELLIGLLFILVFVGCEEGATPPTFIPAVSSTPTVSEPTKPITTLPNDLAWKDLPEAYMWNKYLDDAIVAIPNNTEGFFIKTPCKRLSLKPCAKQLLSIIAKRESNFKTDTKFEESGHLEGVTSRGLFQISKDSANQSAYGCNITNSQQLHDPNINIKCAVKILAYQAKKTGTLIDGKKGGCGAYWSVCRSKNGTSKSYKEISSYMSQF